MKFSELQLHLPTFLTKPDVWSASPVAALWTSLVFVLAVTMVGVLVIFILRRWEGPSHIWTDFIGFLQNADRILITGFLTGMVGTYWSDRTRLVWVPAFFFTFAVLGAFSPWPYCLWCLAFGLFGVLVVFRHWSHKEDAVEFQHSWEKGQSSDLNIELIIGCAFVFVYAPIAFARLHEHTGLFELQSESNPFAFVYYMLIELTKVIPFHEFLPLPKGEQNPPLEVKTTIILFQTTLFVIILTAFKRSFDIAKRVAEGLDLRPAIEALESINKDENRDGVNRLREAALRGRPGARERLIYVLKRRDDQQESSDAPRVDDEADEENIFRYTAMVRFLAANALREIGERLMARANSRTSPEVDPEENKVQAKVILQHAIDGYKAIEQSDWTERGDDWASLQQELGDAYRAFGELESYQERFKRAISAYKRALSFFQTNDAGSPIGGQQRIADLQRRLQEANKELARRRAPNRSPNITNQAADSSPRLSAGIPKHVIRGRLNWLGRVPLSVVPWIATIVLSCWCLIATLSLLTELLPLVGKWSWLISHLPTLVSSILLGFGKWTFEAISAYRDVVGEPGRSLRLTPLPQYLYDAFGLFVCLLGLGFQLIKRETLPEITITVPVFSARLGRSAAALIGSAIVFILLFGIAEASFHWWNSFSFGSRGPTPQGGAVPSGPTAPPDPTTPPGPTTQPKAEAPSIPRPGVPPGPTPGLPPAPPTPGPIPPPVAIPLPPPPTTPLFSLASLSCGKAPPIFWKFGETNLIEADPAPLEVASCHLASVSCEGPIVVGIGTASVKGTDANEKGRALSRGTNLASVLAAELKRRCGSAAPISSYVLNLGRFGEDQQGDKSDQREVIALIGKGLDTDAAVVTALQKVVQIPPWSPHYTVCDLYKMNGSEQPALIETQTKICGAQPSTDVSKR